MLCDDGKEATALLHWKKALNHALVSLLLSVGLTLTLLHALNVSRASGIALLTLVILHVLFVLGRAKRLLRPVIALGGGIAAVAWLLSGGASLMGEVINALIWHTSGQTAVLPLVAGPFAALAAVLVAAVGWFVTQKNAGAYPAVLLVLIAALVLWMLNIPQYIWYLAPAVLGALALLLRDGRDSKEQSALLRVLPLALVITLTGYVGVWIGGVTWEPLQNLAQDIRQRIYDTLFYTEPRDVFSLADVGYYPQGQSQLGGPADPSEAPVMTVQTPRKTYLRGVVKNVYTGRTWEDDIGTRRYLWNAPGYREMRDAAFDADLPSTGKGSELMQNSRLTVKMLSPSASSMFAPQRLRMLMVEGELVPYFNLSSEVFATRNLVAGDTWTIDAPLFTAEDAELRALVPRADDPDDPNWAAVCRDYLQLPDHLDKRVYDLAAQAVTGAETPYEQALALRNFLARSYAYTLDMPEQDPMMDFVSSFLLIHQEGYCTYFASAMTVMCRMVGLPARYVEGFVAYPSAEGQALVTGKEGHAWTEVYFRGFGWVTFDATPTSVEYTSAPMQDENPGSSEDTEDEPTPTPTIEPSPAPTNTPEPEELPTDSPQDESEPSAEPSSLPTNRPAPETQVQEGRSDGKQGSRFPWLWLLALLALAARIVLVQPEIQAKRAKKDFHRWMVWVRANHDALAAIGLRRDAAETPQAFFEDVAQRKILPQQMTALGEMESLMFYGHAAPLAEEIEATRETFIALRKLLPWHRRLLLEVRRVVLVERLRGPI